MSDTPHFDRDPLSEGELDLFARYGRKFTGICLMLASLAALIALATWNVNDPSLNNATSAPIQNWMGFAGSAVADLLFQFFGLAAIVLALLPAIWGFNLYKLRILDVSARQFLSYFAIAVLIAAIATCLPVPISWPLPTGLGGIIGNLILTPVDFFTGTDRGGIISFVIAAILAIPLPFLHLTAFKKTRTQASPNPTQPKAAIHAPEHQVDHEPEVNGGVMHHASTALGAVMHWSYSLSALAFKANKSSAKKRTPVISGFDETMEDQGESQTKSHLSRLITWKEKLLQPDEEDGLDGYLTRLPEDGTPREPVAYRERLPHEPPLAPQGIAGPEEHTPPAPQAEAPQGAMVAQRTVTRVAPQATPTKRGTRQFTEAQGSLPSFQQPENFTLPPLHLLTEAPPGHGKQALSQDALAQNAQLLEGVLEDFSVRGEIGHVRPGPVVTLYELEPAPGIKSSRVIGLADDIARSMSAIAARVAVIPGKNAIGIELPNANRETVYLHESLSSKVFEDHKGKLPICLGKTIGGESVIADLARMPHLLVAGTTGSGKSVAINTMILSLLFRMSPEQCKLIMIDPKMLELSVYDGIPHLLTPVVTDPKKAVVALKWTVREMEERYKKMSKVGVRNIDGFNTRVKQAMEKDEPIVRTIQTGFDQETGEAIYEHEELDLAPMPYIVVIIDEMADLMMVAGKEIEGTVQRLAQMARAAGIHVIMATQRPSVDVITGTIKANFPTRISFQVTSKIDSRTILGEQGAEQLLGMGDMLYMAGGGRIQRVHGPFVSDEDVEEVVRHLKDQGIPQYLEAITEEVDEPGADGGSTGNLADSADPYDQAVAIVLRDKKASTSYIQRRLGIGYNRAASIIERMEEEGVVGPANHAGKREILVGSDPDEDFG